MSYTSLAQSAVDWALSKVGCAYSQAKRTQEDIFDCSSPRRPRLLRPRQALEVRRQRAHKQQGDLRR